MAVKIHMEENTESSLPWVRFSSWLECVCVVTFDLELGQAIELVYPHHVKLTEKEKTSVCYLSFPDSYSARAGPFLWLCLLQTSQGRRRQEATFRSLLYWCPDYRMSTSFGPCCRS
uniref:UDENN domain-containing protein n=1 Tax=Hucho hucho TaxID=62062 RepID=A0A4W5NKW3_9TELE